jgi:hypothetical protein
LENRLRVKPCLHSKRESLSDGSDVKGDDNLINQFCKPPCANGSNVNDIFPIGSKA